MNSKDVLSLIIAHITHGPTLYALTLTCRLCHRLAAQRLLQWGIPRHSGVVEPLWASKSLVSREVACGMQMSANVRVVVLPRGQIAEDQIVWWAVFGAVPPVVGQHRKDGLHGYEEISPWNPMPPHQMRCSVFGEPGSGPSVVVTPILNPISSTNQAVAAWRETAHPEYRLDFMEPFPEDSPFRNLNQRPDVIALCFPLNDRVCFEALTSVQLPPGVPIVLAGTHADELPRTVSAREGVEFAKTKLVDCHCYVETASMMNVRLWIEQLIRAFLIGKPGTAPPALDAAKKCVVQ